MSTLLKKVVMVLLWVAYISAQKNSTPQLPAWLPLHQEIGAAVHLGLLVKSLEELQQITTTEKQWVITIIAHLKAMINSDNVNAELEKKVTTFLESALQSFQQNHSSFDFIKTAISLKNELYSLPENIQVTANAIINTTIQQAINADNPYKDNIAVVQKNDDMSSEEKEWRNIRLKNSVVKTQQQIIDPSINADSALNIGIVMSGGGYRAMTLSAGYLKGLERIGVLDSSLYVSALSGSTWFLAPWMSKNITITQMEQELRTIIANDKLNILKAAHFSALEIQELLLHSIWPKKIFGQFVGPIDFYGSLLAKALFYQRPDPFNVHLSEQYNNIKDGSKPFPLYTAVAIHKEVTEQTQYQYHWYEFNPIQVSNLELGLSIPTWSFGRSFDGGGSIDYAPEQNLGFFMGLWGSAFSFNIKDVKAHFTRKLANTQQQSGFKNFVEKNSYKVALNALSVAEPLFGTILNQPKLESQRIAAVIFNPWKHIPLDKKDIWITQKETITLVDGGIEFNLAVAPFFFKKRNLDLIIICDSSASAVKRESSGLPSELQKLLHYLKRRGHAYNLVQSSFSMQLFKPTSTTLPTIAYINFQKNTALMEHIIKSNHSLKNFVLQNRLLEFNYPSASYKTTNFEYNRKEFDQLRALGEFVIRAQSNELHGLLKELFQAKQHKLLK